MAEMMADPIASEIEVLKRRVAQAVQEEYASLGGSTRGYASGEYGWCIRNLADYPTVQSIRFAFVRPALTYFKWPVKFTVEHRDDFRGEPAFIVKFTPDSSSPI